MTAALDVRELHVLFELSAEAAFAGVSVTYTTSSEPLDEPPGFRVGLMNVNLTVAAGDCLAILGASGSGKSSLLRTIAGLQAMRVGTVRVKGRDVTALPAEQRSVVYLHQEPVLFPHLSVLENVAFPLRIRGVSRDEAWRRAIDRLMTLQVGSVMGNRPDALSGGQRHRVALARALCAEPDVLLLDEPLASLDPAVRSDVRDALQVARAASGAAMVLVTHDLDDALTIATHISAVSWCWLTDPLAPDDLLRSPPNLETARLVGVFAELSGVVSGDRAPVFTWIGGQLPADRASVGAAVACVRSFEAQVLPPGTAGLPVLTVISRTERAHEVLLDLRDAAGETAVVRVGHSAAVRPGESVSIAISHARFFPRH